MVPLHRGIGPLFISPAEETPLQHLYIRLASRWLRRAFWIQLGVRTNEELSRLNPPSEPSAKCVCVRVSSRSPQAISVICVTSQASLLERDRRVQVVSARFNDVEERWTDGGERLGDG